MSFCSSGSCSEGFRRLQSVRKELKRATLGDHGETCESDRPSALTSKMYQYWAVGKSLKDTVAGLVAGCTTQLLFSQERTWYRYAPATVSHPTVAAPAAVTSADGCPGRSSTVETVWVADQGEMIPRSLEHPLSTPYCLTWKEWLLSDSSRPATVTRVPSLW